MIKSAGLVIIYDNKILLGHPTNSKWFGTYSFPKGHVEEGESYIKTAIRETKEEISVDIDPTQINLETESYIDYKNDTGEVYKRVYYYVVHLNDEIQIDKNKLQLEEIDWAGFLNKEEAEKKIFWRFKPILQHLK